MTDSAREGPPLSPEAIALARMYMQLAPAARLQVYAEVVRLMDAASNERVEKAGFTPQLPKKRRPGDD